MPPLPWNYENSLTDMPDIGFRGLWLRVRNRVSLTQLKEISGHNVFLSGPHTNKINVHSDDFGHYNPNFATWALQNIVPELTKEDTRQEAQTNYNTELKHFNQLLALSYLKKSSTNQLDQINTLHDKIPETNGQKLHIPDAHPPHSRNHGGKKHSS